MALQARIVTAAMAAGLCFFGIFGTFGRSLAQTAPAPAAPTAAADPQFEQQKAAFEALSEPDRRAIQDGLMWTGHYLGVVDGAFGKRTRDSIVAWQTAVKAPANGVVTTAQLAVLKASAAKAAGAVGFLVVLDERSGIRIGWPTKLLDKRAAGGARIMKADGSITLDLASVSGAAADLPAMYAKLIADAPGRRIAVKLIRPDFFVASGEEAGQKFYARFAKSPAGLARGFTLTYPAADAGFDRIALAVANSFQPFPEGAAAATPATAAVTPAAPPPPVKPPAPVVTGSTGLVIGDHRVISAIAAGCASPSIGGKAAKILREDKDSGLSLLEYDGAAHGETTFAPPSGDLVVLSASGGGIEVADASLIGDRLLAALPAGSDGSPAFDRSGALAALVGRSPPPKLIAGVAVQAPHPLIDSAAIQRFLSAPDAPPATAPPMSSGELAAARRSLVVAISCRT